MYNISPGTQNEKDPDTKLANVNDPTRKVECANEIHTKTCNNSKAKTRAANENPELSSVPCPTELLLPNNIFHREKSPQDQG